jgi:hypothetical protein
MAAVFGTPAAERARVTRTRLSAAGALLVAACSGERARPPASADTTKVAGCAPGPWTAPEPRAATARAGHLIQLGSFSDSTRAASLRDSLERAGWMAVTRATTAGGRAVTRVHVVPLQGAEMPRLVAFALRRAGHEALVVKDVLDAAVPSSLVLPVNNGTHGMSAITRWILSPGGCALLVEEDPTAVEADALPNGFLFATDVGPFVLQQDSVWDVAPSPSWSLLAYGRAYVIQAGGRDSVLPAQWDNLAARTGLPRDSVRRGAFVSSGMAIAFGFAQPVLVDVSPEVTAAAPLTGIARTAPIPGGWRVGWTARGDLVAVGTAPKYVQDYTPSREWLALDPVTLQPRGPILAETIVPVRWSEGPVLDVSVPLDTVTAPPIEIDGFTITSSGGWITIAPSADTGGRRRIIGPGIALAATRSGRFIAALVPWPDAGRFDQPARLVVYQVTD